MNFGWKKVYALLAVQKPRSSCRPNHPSTVEEAGVARFIAGHSARKHSANKVFSL